MVDQQSQDYMHPRCNVNYEFALTMFIFQLLKVKV